MSKAKIIHQYPDGSATLMEITTTANGPDSMDEAMRRVMELWRECVADTAAEDQP